MGWPFRSAGELGSALEALAGPLELGYAVDRQGRPFLAGKHRGVWIELRPSREGLSVRAELAAPLPSGLVITRRADRTETQERELPIGDPELDARIRVDAREPTAAIRLLRRPELRDPLAGFFSLPSASVEGNQLAIPVADPGALPRIREAMRATSLLADALSRSALALQEAHRAAIAEARRSEEHLAGRRFIRLPIAQKEPDRIREAHAVLRRNLLRFAALPGFCGGVVGSWGVASYASQVRGDVDLRVSAVVFGFGLLGCALGGIFWLYCCPACGGRLARPGSLLSLFFPSTCPHCLAGLR